MADETIVVGVDGSPPSADALAWAVREARLRGARLDVVHAWHIATMAYGSPIDEATLDAVRAAARDVVGRALGAVDTTGVEVRTSVLEGGAAEVLVDKSKLADLLVVGARGRGGFASLLLGSVSHQCASHARCPVVIVRP